jgi:signal transduction histidine kinase
MAQAQPVDLAPFRRIPAAALILAGLTSVIALVDVIASGLNGRHPDLQAIGLITFLAFPAMGVLLVARLPSNPVGWLLLGIGLNTYLLFGLEDYAVLALITYPGIVPLPLGHFFEWLSGVLWVPFILMVLLFLPMLFPTGRLLSKRWRAVIVSGLIFALLAFLGNGFRPGGVSQSYPQLHNPYAISGANALFDAFINLSLPFGVVALLGMIASLVLRYRRAEALQRRQLRWFLFAVVLAVIPFMFNDINTGISEALVIVVIPLLPVSIAVAILRYRLYDIDIVINRTLVYGALAVFITALYVAIVAGVGALIGTQGRFNLILSISATGVVAIAFEPARTRLQRLANRIVYGERATPYEVMAGFGARMAATLSADEVLPRMAEAAARGVGAAAARVTVIFPGGSERVMWWPREVPAVEGAYRLPVTYRSEQVGELAVIMPPGQRVNPGEARLLVDLAGQAGLVLHNVRLNDELQARFREVTSQAEAIRGSRQRLVTVADAERQRLVESIHRGPEQQLKTMERELRAIEGDISGNPADTAARLERLTSDAQTSLEELRQLARGVYPALLRDRGLVTALRSEVTREGKTVGITADGVDRFPTEIEAAAYFSCQEILLRADRLSRIELSQGDDALEFSAFGPPAELAPIIDSLEDRLEALGGGLSLVDDRLIGRIPTRVAEPVG